MSYPSGMRHVIRTLLKKYLTCFIPAPPSLAPGAVTFINTSAYANTETNGRCWQAVALHLSV